MLPRQSCEGGGRKREKNTPTATVACGGRGGTCMRPSPASSRVLVWSREGRLICGEDRNPLPAAPPSSRFKRENDGQLA
jgi:hypothetical protein